MKIIQNIFCLFIFLGCLSISSQENKEKLKIYSFSEVELLQKVEPRPLLIYIYTDWCKFCFGMNKNTFENKEVTKILNDKFYFIKLNAEEKNHITFLNHTFKYKPTGNNTGIHELAKELATINKRISYPTTTILNTNFEILIQMSGVKTAKEMRSILFKI